MTTPSTYTPTVYVDDSTQQPVGAVNLNKNERALKDAFDMAVQAVSSDAVGQPNGVMGLDEAGVGAQPPKAHGHTIPFTDEAGNTQQVTGIEYDGDTGAVTFAGGIAKINGKSKYVKVFPVQQVSGADPYVTNTLTPATLAITQTIEPGAEYDFVLNLWTWSSTAAQAKAIVNADAGAFFRAQFIAPRQYKADGTTLLTANSDGGLDVDMFRMTPIISPANGLQRAGGFMASSSRTVTDGHTTSGSTAVTSATAAFGPYDAGAPISGTGVPANAFIVTVVSATQVVISSAATATGTAVSVTIAGPVSPVPILIKGYIRNPTGSALSMTTKYGQIAASPCRTSVEAGTSSLLMARR